MFQFLSTVIKTIVRIILLFIIYWLICSLWGLVYRFYKKLFFRYDTTAVEELEFGENVLGLIFIAFLAYMAFPELRPEDKILNSDPDPTPWKVFLIDVIFGYIPGFLTIFALVLAGLLDYDFREKY